MKVSTSGDPSVLAGVPQAARDAEALGYDVFAANETAHNPFIPIALAAEHTSGMRLLTSIALAFPRSPMDMAYMAWDLQALSRGRLLLGLGSQVKGHIVRRFSAPWSEPARRMREYVAALRHIWDCWQHGTKLSFKGDFYSFNLMPPLFNPGPLETPDIKVFAAAVNPAMLRVAGEVCDGVLLHSFCSWRYTEEVVLANLRKGAARAGRDLCAMEVSGGGIIITGADEAEVARNRAVARRRIAFYASTPAYAPVMELHGWAETQHRLYRMSVDAQWSGMADLITDEMLAAFAVEGIYDDIVPRIKERYGAFATMIAFSIPVRGGEDRERLQDMLTQLHAH